MMVWFKTLQIFTLVAFIIRGKSEGQITSCFGCPKIFNDYNKDFMNHGKKIEASPRDIEILDTNPAGPVLPHGEKVPL